VSVTARGGGTSQSGQTVNSTLIVDCSKHLDRVLELDVAGKRCVVEPGIVLDELNRRLKPHGLWFPVDISTASRATIGGMVGNNSCGARSLRYGNTRENVLSIDAIMADGSSEHFGPAAPIRRSSRWRAACSRSPPPTRGRSRPTSRRCSGGSAATREMGKMSAQLRSPRVVSRLIAGLGAAHARLRNGNCRTQA
jgi:hypothetical protein